MAETTGLNTFPISPEQANQVLPGLHEGEDSVEVLPLPECTSESVLTANFINSLSPLVQALRGHAVYGSRTEAMLFANPQGYTDTVGRFLISRGLLERQRLLSTREAAYIESVEHLSSVNPYIVAAGVAAPEVTNICLDAELARRSQATREALPDGSYTPLVVAGVGIHGTIAAGEILRQRPDLAADAVFLDKAKTAGGVFAKANGPAHNLNSATYIGNEPFQLPDVTDGTLREFAGIFPQYPGERTDPRRGRTGSINRLIPYFPAPDELKKAARYITNWHLALMAKEQAALTVANFMGETELIQAEPNLDGGPGLFKLTLRDQSEQGTATTRTLYTDSLLLPTGLGKPRRVVKDNEFLQQILDAQRDKPGLPYYTDAIDAYNFFADQTREKEPHGRRIAIIGNGDTAATLAEALGGLFETGNIDDIDEIYIVAEASVSERCRYALIADLLERKTGRKNILQYVERRVGEVLFRNPFARDPDTVRNDGLALVDTEGFLISKTQQNSLDILVVDHVIEATGFSSRVEEILKPLLGQQKLADATEGITLPSDPNVVLGQRLRNYPEIAILGTASDPAITPEKLAQYPQTTQEVLRLVDENVVAIGLRGLDTTAAARTWLGQYAPQPAEQPIIRRAPGKILSTEPAAIPVEIRTVNEPMPPVNRHVVIDDGLLTPLLLTPLAKHRLANHTQVTGSVRGRATYNATIYLDGNEVSVVGADDMPAAVLNELAGAASDSYFRAYANEAMRQRRGSEGIDVRVTYQNGRLVPAKSIVQAA